MQKHSEWIDYADGDLKAALKLLRPPEIMIPSALYHTQQCAEKALKAFLIYKKQQPRKIHDLLLLLDLCTHFDQEFSSLMKHAAELNPYISGTRYPDSHFYTPDVSVANSAVKSATIILDFVKSKI